MSRESGFLVDEITNSIEEIATGKTFETEMAFVTSKEIKTIHKKDGWLFNWKTEFKEHGHQLFKLVLEGDERIQGLISLEPIHDQFYVEMHLIENAPQNRADNKEFAGVAANMVAFACKMSFDLGFDGFVAFTAKTSLVDHYAGTIGAQLIYSNNRMGIFTQAAKFLVNSYYKNYLHGR
jgi:hypothetical protein